MDYKGSPPYVQRQIHILLQPYRDFSRAYRSFLHVAWVGLMMDPGTRCGEKAYIRLSDLWITSVCSIERRPASISGELTWRILIPSQYHVVWPPYGKDTWISSAANSRDCVRNVASYDWWTNQPNAWGGQDIVAVRARRLRVSCLCDLTSSTQGSQQNTHEPLRDLDTTHVESITPSSVRLLMALLCCKVQTHAWLVDIISHFGLCSRIFKFVYPDFCMAEPVQIPIKYSIRSQSPQEDQGRQSVSGIPSLDLRGLQWQSRQGRRS